MIMRRGRSLASAGFYPVLIAVSAALAMRYSMYWIHTTQLRALVPAVLWIIATAVAVRTATQLRIDAQTVEADREPTEA
jgi:hypothetical protein